MTAYAGVYSLQPPQRIEPTTLSVDVENFDLTLPGLGVVAGGPDNSGASAAGSPVAYPQSALTGAISPGSEAQHLGRVIVWPRSIAMGLVLSAKVYEIGIWNTTGRAQELTEWTLTDLDQVDIDNTDGAPVAYLPWQFRDYEITVQPSGQAAVDGSVNFVFVGGITGTDVSLTGTRITLFAFRPNWREPVGENLEWLTDILTAHDQTEQRLALRQHPRRQLDYLITLTDAGEVARCQAQVYAWQARAFAVPVWTDWQLIGASLPAGSLTIPASTPYRDFEVGQLAVLWRDDTTWEVVDVDTVGASSITVALPTQQAWTATDRLVPLRMGRMPQQINMRRPTATIAEASVSFSLEPGTAIGSNSITAPSPTQYLGLDVLTEPPTQADDPDEDWSRDVEIVDANTGAWAVYERSTSPRVARPYSWLLQGRAAISSFLGLLDRRKGRLVPFWMPTWSHDLVQNLGIGAADTALRVDWVGFTRHLLGKPNRSNLAFYPATGGAPILRAITGASEDPANGNETISIDAAFGAAKAVGDFQAISYLVKCRLDQDSVSLVWHTDELVEVRLRIVEVDG